jgi:hypothetical protein
MFLRSSRAGFVRKAALAILPAALITAGYAGTATASTSQESLIQDDAIFGSSDPNVQTEGFDTADGLGAGTIHTLVGWTSLAPGRDDSKKPSGFDGSSPKDYPATAWDHIDDLVRNATKRHWSILMTPTGPTPKWATGCSSANCRPKPAEYQKFVQALATRYSGKYRDENQGGGKLPKVKRFSLWNEPNEKGWLMPQSTGVNAGVYRDLFNGGVKGLKKAKYRGQLLLGDMAPLHNSLLFWANLMCVDLKGKVLKGKAAKKADCKSGKKLKRFPVDGIAIHPYDRGGRPPFKKPKKYDVNLVGLPKLEALLDKAAKVGVVKKRIPIYFTEFGVSTRPEETKFGVTYEQQAEAINHAEYVGYLNKRVKSYAQYELNNDAAISIFQTGLRTLFQTNGVVTNKQPTVDAYRMPLFVVGKATKATVWGGFRPAGKQRVAIQVGKGSSFKTIKTVKTSKYGYFQVRGIKVGSGKQVRLEWSGRGQTTHSRVAKVEKRV